MWTYDDVLHGNGEEHQETSDSVRVVHVAPNVVEYLPIE